MEVSLFAGENLPNGAIYSVRAGTSRRQAAAANHRCFRFPSKPLDSPLKVEVFRPVGVAYVVLRPGEDQYKVQFKPVDDAEGPPISCELHVKGSKEGDATPQSQAEEPKETTAGAKEAKDWLERHQVMQTVQAVLQSVMKDRPVDPFAYMSRHFSSGYEPLEKRSPLPAGIAGEKPSESTIKPQPGQTAEEAAPAEDASEPVGRPVKPLKHPPVIPTGSPAWPKIPPLASTVAPLDVPGELHRLRSELGAFRRALQAEVAPSSVPIALMQCQVVAAPALRSQLQAVHARIEEVGPLDVFRPLVDCLRRPPKHADKGKVKTPEVPQLSAEDCHVSVLGRMLDPVIASRRALETASDCVAANVGEEELDEVIKEREAARQAHQQQLQYVLESLLRAAGFTDVPGVKSGLEQAMTAAAELAAAVEEAAERSEGLGESLGTAARGSQKPGAEGAVEAHDLYVASFDSASFATAADAAAQALQLPAMRLQLACHVSSDDFRVFFHWEWVEEENELAVLAMRLQAAEQTLDAEEHFWRSVDPVAMAPAQRVLAEGLGELERRQAEVAFLREVLQQHAALARELADQRQLTTRLETEVPKAEEELYEALEARQKAQEQADLARIGFERENFRPMFKQKPKAAEAREERLKKAAAAVAEAKGKVRQADCQLLTVMQDIAKLVPSFPELAGCDLLTDQLGTSLPFELLPFWQGCRSLHKDYDEFVHIDGRHNHIIARARQGDTTFVVKEYAITETNLRTCLREAALLVRLRHPHVVEVLGLFTDREAKRVCMQMPFYAEGSLDEWVRRRNPDDMSVRRACGQTLSALAHFHTLNVVHSDVKPKNVFVDSAGKAYLGDLDCSVDAATRCSTVHMATRAAFTRGYEAPELMMTGATPRTDVYAFGQLLLSKEPDLLPSSRARDALAKAMTAHDPGQRPTAQEALDDSFFQEVLRDLPDQRLTCVICLQQTPAAKGAVCGHSHFTCSQCLGTFVRAELELTMSCNSLLQAHRARRGKLPCPACKHAAMRDASDTSCYLAEVQLARSLTAADFELYEAAKDDAVESRIWEEQQRRFLERVRQLESEFSQRRVMQLVQEREAATLEYLRRQFPDALQCPRCGLGPFIPTGCPNLESHHGERTSGGGVISNACNGCGFFARERSEWATWNGQLSTQT